MASCKRKWIRQTQFRPGTKTYTKIKIDQLNCGLLSAFNAPYLLEIAGSCQVDASVKSRAIVRVAEKSVALAFLAINRCST